MLYEMERLRPRQVLGHQVGEGSLCLVCGSGCSGLQLHYWRRVCLVCGCRQEDHQPLLESDQAEQYVGRISDRS